MWTILTLLKEAERFLAEKGVSSPRLEAEVLLAHTLSFDRVMLYAHYSKPVSDEERARFRNFVLRRIKGEPTAYLTGTREFFSLPFLVTPEVLIPRPETEELVQEALDAIGGDGAGATVLDVGTGSGCIGLTLLKLRRGLRVVATDISTAALRLARENAAKLALDGRIRFLCADLLGSCRGCSFDLILCNPPYVDPAGKIPFSPDVAKWEPRHAVFTPPGDPLYYYRRIFEGGGALLKGSGSLIFEAGLAMREPLEALGRRTGWRLKGLRRDLAGVERVLVFAPPE